MTKILLATRNAGKLVELRRMLDSAGIEVLGLADVDEFPEAPETGATFAENALAKARDAVAATGLPAVADDSGIAVDALNGMPGVLSARWCARVARRHRDRRPRRVAGQAHPRPPRHRRVRLRPHLRAGRRGADLGRDGTGGEGRRVAPRPRDAGAAAVSR
jgi:inosine/xanthosine triphosphate pyrophosphatase family protein